MSLGSILGPEFAAAPALLFGPDQFHPSAEGYRSLAGVMVPSILAAIGVIEPDEKSLESLRGEGVLPISDAAIRAVQVPGTELDGTEVGGARHRVGAAQRLRYSGSPMHALERVDTDVATAWRRGELVFRQEPLRNVIAEVNRYRPGRIVIASAALRERRINGTFFLGQLDEVIEQVRAGLGARVTRLPGDVVVLA